METRYRQRYVDLIVTPKAVEIFKARTRIVRELRAFLDQAGFMGNHRRLDCQIRLVDGTRAKSSVILMDGFGGLTTWSRTPRNTRSRNCRLRQVPTPR